MSKKAQHVVPTSDGGWSVRKSGASKATKSFASKDDAVTYAKDLAKKQSAELYIHRKDGTIKGTQSYSVEGKTRS